MSTQERGLEEDVDRKVTQIVKWDEKITTIFD